MSEYNLIDEKWIPVRFPDGTRDELGISDVLLRSKEIAAIEDPSPLVVAALHRFLLAVLYRVLEGPTDIDQAKALFKSGLPADKITTYLKKWRNRFWLFDEKYPFGQNPNVSKEELEPWTKLTSEYNATSNKVLFDHTDTKKPGGREPRECARWLLSTMTFSISGGRGYYPSPSPNAMMCIPIGRNLFETMCYCLVPYPNREVMLGDYALWEYEPKTLPLASPKEAAPGYASMYTWPARMVLLEKLPSGLVSIMRFVAGTGFENPANTPDAMHPYRIDEKKGPLPIQFRTDKGTWRDYDSLLPGDDDSAPKTIQHALRLAGNSVEKLPASILVLGLRYDPPNANLDFWRMERFVLPKALAGDHSIRFHIKQLLTDAEDTQKSLWLACNAFARDMISRGDRDPDKSDVKKFIGQMTPILWYWSFLEQRFHEILREYTLESDFEDIRWMWMKYVRTALETAWEQHSASVSTGDAWAIRALVKAETHVNKKLKELSGEIKKLEPKKEAV